MKTAIFAIICLIMLILFFAIKALNYYLALCGVMHYLTTKYNDELSAEKIKELTAEASRHIFK